MGTGMQHGSQREGLAWNSPRARSFSRPCDLERSNAAGKRSLAHPINLAEEADGRLFLLLTDRRANCWNDQEDVIEGQS